jgi:hypothetical protein
MTTAHDQLLAAHCGAWRTLSRILSKFCRPGVSADVRRYVHTCDICQKTVARGKVQSVPLAFCQQEEITQEHSPERPLSDPSVSVGVIQDEDDTSIPVPMPPSTQQEDISMIDHYSL